MCSIEHVSTKIGQQKEDWCSDWRKGHVEELARVYDEDFAQDFSAFQAIAESSYHKPQSLHRLLRIKGRKE
jgi:hypothetical protein